MGLAEHKVIDAGAMTGTAVVTSKATSLRTLKLASYQAKWSGTPTGTFKVEASNDRDPDRNADANWVEVTLDRPPANPAGSASGWLLDLTDLPFAWVRLVYTNASGTGTLDAWFHGRG